jgi:hypothetical protein
VLSAVEFATAAALRCRLGRICHGAGSPASPHLVGGAAHEPSACAVTGCPPVVARGLRMGTAGPEAVVHPGPAVC